MSGFLHREQNPGDTDQTQNKGRRIARAVETQIRRRSGDSASCGSSHPRRVIVKTIIAQRKSFVPKSGRWEGGRGEKDGIGDGDAGRGWGSGGKRSGDLEGIGKDRSTWNADNGRINDSVS